MIRAVRVMGRDGLEVAGGAVGGWGAQRGGERGAGGTLNGGCGTRRGWRIDRRKLEAGADIWTVAIALSTGGSCGGSERIDVHLVASLGHLVSRCGVSSVAG